MRSVTGCKVYVSEEEEEEEEEEETGNGNLKTEETGETARVEKTTKSDPPTSLSKKKTTKNKLTPACFHEKSGDLIVRLIVKYNGVFR